MLDASECPPTFGVPRTMVQGIIAGGDVALRYAVEGAEDNYAQGQEDLKQAAVSRNDVVVAISASGYAPYCVGSLDYARSVGALAVSLACNEHTELARHADLAIEAPTGPEVLMGSTRLKAGTATKMILNMLTTGAMVRTGRVYQNLMVDLCISNSKLSDRRCAFCAMRRAWGKRMPRGFSSRPAAALKPPLSCSWAAWTPIRRVGRWRRRAAGSVRPFKS